jgi:hypothetical protein
MLNPYQTSRDMTVLLLVVLILVYIWTSLTDE